MTRTEDTRDAGPVHFDGEHWVYRASGLGGCLGGLVRARMGVDADAPPDWLQEKFDQGVALEDQVLNGAGVTLFDQKSLTDRGFVIDGLGQIEGELRIPVPGGEEVVVRCHPDGMAVWDKKVVAVEGKATTKGYADTILKELPPFYAWQISVEALVCDVEKVLLVVGIKNEAGDGVEAGTEIVDWKTQLLDPPYSRADVMKRVWAVEKHARNNDVPFCEYAQYPCGYWQDHDPDDPMWQRDEDVELVWEDAKEMADLAVRYSIAHGAEKEAKEAKKNIGRDIAKIWAKLGKKGARTQVRDAQGRRVKVVDVVQNRMGGVDWEKVSEDYPGLDLSKSEYQKPGFEVRYPKIEIEEIKDDEKS